MCCSSRSHKELGTTDWLNNNFLIVPQLRNASPCRIHVYLQFYFDFYILLNFSWIDTTFIHLKSIRYRLYVSRYAKSSGFIKTHVWKSLNRNNEIKIEKHCFRYWVNHLAIHETVLHNCRTVLLQIPTLLLRNRGGVAFMCLFSSLICYCSLR